MSIDFKELAKDRGYFNQEENVGGLSFHELKQEKGDPSKNFTPDKYSYEGHRITWGARVEIEDATKPIELEVTFNSSSIEKEYPYEIGLVVSSRSPLWLDSKTRANENRIFLPNSETFPLPLIIKPHKAKKKIDFSVYPARYHAESKQFDIDSTFASLDFMLQDDGSYNFVGSANDQYPDFTDLLGTFKSSNYDLSKFLTIR
jgi:hypothetical protein